MGRLALYCCSLARKRLEALNKRVIIRSARQPASLASLTSNRDMIGRTEKYSFATGSCLKTFEKMLSLYCQGTSTSCMDVIRPVLSKMVTSNTLPKQTKQALLDIHSKSTASIRSIKQRIREFETGSDDPKKIRDTLIFMMNELTSVASANKDMPLLCLIRTNTNLF